MGEALGEQEAKQGGPFKGPAGWKLESMIERAGFKRSQFQLINAAWCRPPNNSTPPPEAVQHCKQYWEPLAKADVCKVIMPLGNVALNAVLGFHSILSKRGYVWWEDAYDAFVLPTVHPSYIMRGNGNWEATFIYDLRHAVDVATNGWSPVERDYLLDPPPFAAMAWAQTYANLIARRPDLAVLGTDIETPDKSQSEDETDISLGYMRGVIYRIGFAFVDEAGRTQVLSIPWHVSYREVIEFLLGLPGIQAYCNRHFDVPRIRAHDVKILGRVEDIQEMWHVLHSDLNKALEHMAPYLCPNQPAWKHLSYEKPALYNGIDAGVQVECRWRLKELLEASGQWALYQEHIFELNPILVYMGEQGMPTDNELRKQSAWELQVLKEKVRVRLNDAAEGARPEKIYKRFVEGLQTISIEVEEKYCSECGKVRVSKKHPCFKVGVAAGEVALGELHTRSVRAIGYVRPLDFKPSNPGLVRYAKYKGYKLISYWDKDTQSRKVSMDENALRRMALNYPEDPIFALALEERELTKLQGTYVGRLVAKELVKDVKTTYTFPAFPDHILATGDNDDDIPF